MLANAFTHHTTAAFTHVVGSQFVQKYLDEGFDNNLHSVHRLRDRMQFFV